MRSWNRSKATVNWVLFGGVGLFVLIACSLPYSLAERYKTANQEATLTPTISPSPPAQASRIPEKKPETDTPTPELSVPGYPGIPIPGEGPGPYPPPGATFFPVTSITASPTTGDLGTPAASPGSETNATPLSGYPPILQPGAGLYPGIGTLFPTFNPYPGLVTGTSMATQAIQSTSTPTISTVPAVPASPTTSMSPVQNPTQTSSVNANPTISSAQVTPTPTPVMFTPTSSATATPFLTPTPTSTYTPTPTRTPLPPPPWMSVELKASDPSKVKLASGKPQLIEFFAFWSGPCLAMAPIIKGVEDEYIGSVYFTYLDIDDPAVQPFKQSLNFRLEPQFILLDEQGKILKQWQGYVTVEQLRAALDAALD